MTSSFRTSAASTRASVWGTASGILARAWRPRQKYCNLGARCSNAPRTLSTLQLFETSRDGLGVYTTTDLDVGDVLGEYCGELTEFPAVAEGQPPLAVKENSGTHSCTMPSP
ncbi:hypothetical protein PF005_g8479 [Phytophthora fragariae]|uniref:SET domain-containing protein n=1 Tax=Phytophthora fragariae TaxID=53985 RepID=A0A6A3UEB7_9STRA|nr:hypothetical protein PF003_g16964 [Phytophthora fragariae]KAE8941134.1 hypothetical protein PF009_g9067 [Phytophthora fragariae]KAE9149893.1 hypothetical protein PF006_g5666 [Phytophthora fragariae]KAE9217902.1 hypothetical protein PF005_g8479 [Phytophthora fragariae]KAE9241077.1 hypothetical protein PF002_g9449 [Phytophthora fragariae]